MIPKKISLRVSLSLLCFISPFSLSAENLPTIVVTSDKQERSLEETSSSVTVISREEIRQKAASNVTEVLKGVVGVDFVFTGAAGDDTDIRIRGSDRDEVLVLVDGVSINNISEHRPFFLSSLPVDSIERIEVVRGPQSIMYGSDAVGGVINIITRRGSGKPRYDIGFEAGNLGTFHEYAGTSGAVDRFDYNLSVSRTDQKGRFDRDRFGSLATSGNFGFQFSPEFQARAGINYLKSDQELFSEFLTSFDAGTGSLLVAVDPDINRQLKTDLLTTNVELEVLPTDWWRSELHYGLFVDLENLQNPSTGDVAQAGFTPGAQSFDSTGMSHTVDLRNFFMAFDSKNLVLESFFGFEFQTESLRFTDDPLDGSAPTVFPDVGQEGNRQNYAPYFQQTAFLFDRTLQLAGGARFDHNTTFGNEWSPRASILYSFKKTGTTFRGVYGEGFHAPTLTDFFDQILLQITGDPSFEAVRLEPELSQSYEAGIEQKLGTKATVGSTFYYVDFDQLFDGLQSIPDAYATGVESSLQMHPWEWLTLGGSYTFQRARNETSQTRLAERPNHLWKAFIVGRPLPSLSLRSDVRVVTDRAVPAVLSTAGADLPLILIDAQGNPSGANLDGYVTVDFAADWEVLKEKGVLDSLRVYGKVLNLLDDQYQEKFGFDASGITFLLGTKASF